MGLGLSSRENAQKNTATNFAVFINISCVIFAVLGGCSLADDVSHGFRCPHA